MLLKAESELLLKPEALYEVGFLIPEVSSTLRCMAQLFCYHFCSNSGFINVNKLESQKVSALFLIGFLLL